MKRRLLNVLAGLSMLLCLATAVMWVRSYWVVDAWMWQNSSIEGDCVTLHTFGFTPLAGVFLFYYSRAESTSSHEVEGIRTSPPDRFALFHSQSFRVGPLGFQLTGFYYRSGFSSGLTLHGNDPAWAPLNKELSVPAWALLFCWALTPMASFRGFAKRLRARKRLASGRCAACGYDLRAHQPGDRCPECATPVPAKQDTTP